MGDRWGPANLYEKHLKAAIKKQDTDGAIKRVINVNSVMLNAELHALHRALQSFQLGALSAGVTAVHARLDRLKKG